MDSAGSFYALVRQRRSVRRYLNTPVPRDVVERLIAAAIWAPSAHNRQPWRFAILIDPNIKRQLAAEMGDRLRADRLADGAPPHLVEADVERSRERINGAPVAVAVCLSMRDMDVYADQKRTAAEYTMATQSVAMAVQNFLLAAHTEGLGACWMCAPLFCPEVVSGALRLPPDWQPQALITLGYPHGQIKPAARHPIESVTTWR